MAKRSTKRRIQSKRPFSRAEWTKPYHLSAAKGSTMEEENTKQTSASKEQTSRSSRIVNPTAKAREGMASSAWGPKPPPTREPSREVNELIVQLKELFKIWNEYDIREAKALPSDEDPIKILATKIHSTNSPDQDHFICATQFDVEELKTYVRAM